MPEAELNGVSTYWRVFGEGPVPALALHCSLAHSGAWTGLANDLPDLCITAPDMPAHGKSADWDGESDLHSDATRIAMAMLQERGGEPMNLIGHSFGAVVALRIALEAPELVASLTLFEPVLFCAARAADSPEFVAYREALQPFADALQAGDREAAAASFQAIWGRGVPFEALPGPQRDYIAQRIHLIPAQNGTLIDDGAGILAPMRLEGLGMPVLLMEGGESPPVINAINTELARRLPNVRREVVAGAGHMLPITHAGECAKIVSDFLLPVAALPG